MRPPRRKPLRSVLGLLAVLTLALVCCHSEDDYLEGYWRFGGVFEGSPDLYFRHGVITIIESSDIGLSEDTGIVWGRYSWVGPSEIHFSRLRGNLEFLASVEVGPDPVMTWKLAGNREWRFLRISP